MTYLQLGAAAITGAWGHLTEDALSVAAQLRTEVQPLLAAAAAGEYSFADLSVAVAFFADGPKAPRGRAAAAVDEGKNEGMIELCVAFVP
jgi:hypothetical protein